MASNFRKAGVSLAVQNAERFRSQMQAADRAVRAFQSNAGRTRALNLVSEEGLSRLDALKERIFSTIPGMNRLASAMGTSTTQLAAMTSAATAGAAALVGIAAAAVAATTAFLALGKRGAALPGVIEGFEITALRADTTADVLLGKLRRAAAGTVRDLNLMKNANFALAGAGEQLSREFGQNLPRLLEIARVQARVTGQDVDYLFNSLVTGIKRTSPMLIDNTGLVLKLSEANERYAEALGKTAEQLTAEEKQIAILNATLEAGARSIELYSAKTVQASERLARINTTISNLLDRMAVAVQPLFNFIVQVGEAFLNILVPPLEVAIALFYELSNAIIGPIQTAFTALQTIVQQVFAPVGRLIGRWVTYIIATIRLLGEAWDWLLRQGITIFSKIAQVVAKFVGQIIGVFDPQAFFEGGAQAFGALAAGIMHAANQYIFPTVISIAQFIADFLMGLSPPPKGPLSTIDKGAAKVMEAWLEGFTGVSLLPVEQVAAAIDAELGDIGKLTYEQVQARIEQLDRAIQPFIDQLAIVKARVETIVNPLERIEELTKRRLGKALEQWTKGALDAESVRAIDRQMEALRGQIDAYQDLTSEAEYQLELMKLRQASERVLLDIQARRTKGQEDEADALKEQEERAKKVLDAIEKATTPKALKEAKERAGGGGGGADDVPAVGGEALPQLGGGDALSSFLGIDQEAIEEAMFGIRKSFLEGWYGAGGDQAMAEFGANVEALRTELDRIQSVDIGDRLKKRFEELKKNILKPLKDVAQWVNDKWDKVFGPEGVINTVVDFADLALKFATFAVGGTIRSAVSGFVSWVSLNWPGLETIFNDFTLDDLLELFREVFEVSLRTPILFFKTYLSMVFGETGSLSISAILDKFSLDGLLDLFKQVFGVDLRKPILFFKTYLGMVFGETGSLSIGAILDKFSLDNLIQLFVDTFELSEGLRRPIEFFKTFFDLFLNGEGARSLATLITNFSLQTLIDTFSEAMELPGKGVRAVLDAFADVISLFFQNEAGGTLYDAMSSIGTILTTLLVNPARKVANAFIKVFTEMVNKVIDGINFLIRSWNALPFGGGVELPEIPKIPKLGEDEVEIVPNTATPVPHGRRGMIVGQGWSQVHRDELIYSPSSAIVFPQALSRAIMRMVSAPAPMSLGRAGGTSRVSNNTTNTTSNTFNVHGQQSMRLALAQARAFRG